MIRIINDIPLEVVNHIYNVYKNEEWHKLDCIGRGASGKVYQYRDYAVKRLLRKNVKHKDIEILEALQGVSCIPTLFATIDERVIIMDRVKGVTLYQYIYGNVKIHIDPKFDKLYEQGLIEIIKVGYSPKDLHEENIMIDQNGKPVIVDVGLFQRVERDLDDKAIEILLQTNDDAIWSLNLIRQYVLKRKKKREKVAV